MSRGAGVHHDYGEPLLGSTGRWRGPAVGEGSPAEAAKRCRGVHHPGRGYRGEPGDGKHGAALIGDGDTVLTHRNAALATVLWHAGRDRAAVEQESASEFDRRDQASPAGHEAERLGLAREGIDVTIAPTSRPRR